MAANAGSMGGLITDLITPVRDGRLDEPALMRLVERQVRAGVSGVVVGSHATGEAACLSEDEQRRLLGVCAWTLRGRAVLIADVSSNATANVLATTRLARAAGADAVLVATPWYNRPNQEGLFRHYQAVSESTDIAIVVSNDPQRSGVDVTEDTLARIVALDRVAAWIEVAADSARFGARRALCGPRVALLSGCDATGLGAVAQGAQGMVSIIANVFPDAVRALCRAAIDGDRAAGLRCQDYLRDVQRALSRDPTPATVKQMVNRLGLCRSEIRWPGATYAEPDVDPALVAL